MNALIGDPRRVTRLLLSCGIAAGPLFFSVAIIQALTRPGYNIRQNAISLGLPRFRGQVNVRSSDGRLTPFELNG